MIELRAGDCHKVLSTLPDASVDAIVTDPPYELAFMGRGWDASGIAYDVNMWTECLRVLKPGGHLLAFGGTRTYHRMTCAIEDAGFEVRDSLHWLYGSGFPKGVDVGKAAGVAWDGWNTSLKPAHEPIVLARKPLSATVAGNVLEHGTGALNIAACRVATSEDRSRPPRSRVTSGGIYDHGRGGSATPSASNPAGRWPANVLLCHLPECGPEEGPKPCAPGCAVAELDAQSGDVKGSHAQRHVTDGRTTGDNAALGKGIGHLPGTSREGYNDSGGASRFYPQFRYCPKAPTSERPRIDGKGWPTVKPLALMRWLVRLVTPPDGLVLDPFAGTGTTLQAAEREGFSAIGIERDPLALALARRRLGLPEPGPTLNAQLAGLSSPTLLDLVRRARDLSALILLYRAHCTTWPDEVNQAAKARRRELESGTVYPEVAAG